MNKNHSLKVTKDVAGIYTTCCGETVQYYTSSQFGLPASNGWYITNSEGESDLNRFETLAEVKKFLLKAHDFDAYMQRVLAESQATLDAYALSKVGA